MLRPTLIVLVVAAVAEPTHAMLDTNLETELDTAHRSARTFSLATLLQPLRVVLGSRTLAELAVVSFIYAGTQVCLTSFIVVYLTESLRWSLVGAGFVLTAATVGGVVGRIGWGLVADRVAPPRRVLGVIGVIAAICGVVITLATPAWSTKPTAPRVSRWETISGAAFALISAAQMAGEQPPFETAVLPRPRAADARVCPDSILSRDPARMR